MEPQEAAKADLQQSRPLSPWWLLLCVSVLAVAASAICSQDLRAVFINSAQSVWVLLGYSFFFLVEAVVRVWSHRDEKKEWKDAFDIAKKYLKSPSFIRPAIIVYVIFLLVTAINVPLKMRELRLEAKTERALGTERARERHSKQQSAPEAPALMVGASNFWKDIATNVAKEKEERTKRERVIIADAAKRDGGLKEIAERPVTMPDIPGGGSEIDWSSVDDLASAFGEAERKETAKRLLEEQAKPKLSKEALLSLSSQIVDYYCDKFTNALAKLATESGDKLVFTYTNASALINWPDMGCADMKFEQHPEWRFRYCFRKISDTEYHWHILTELGEGKTMDFTCNFQQTRFDYYLRNTPKELNDSGNIKSVGTTNFMPALTVILGIQKSRFSQQ